MLNWLVKIDVSAFNHWMHILSEYIKTLCFNYLLLFLFIVVFHGNMSL